MKINLERRENLNIVNLTTIDLLESVINNIANDVTSSEIDKFNIDTNIDFEVVWENIINNIDIVDF